MHTGLGLLVGLLFSLTVSTLQKGIPSRGTGRGGPGALLTPRFRGAGPPQRGISYPLPGKGIQAPRGVIGYRPGTGAGIPLGNGARAGKVPGYGLGNGIAGRQPGLGYGVPVNGYQAAFRNGFADGRARAPLRLGNGKPGKAPEFLMPGRRLPLVQRPVAANGYLADNGYANGALNGYGAVRPYTNGALLPAGPRGKGPGLAGYGAGIIPGAGAIPGAIPALQPAVGYGNGYPSIPVNGGGYGLKPGKDLAPSLPFNGQPGVGAGLLPFDLTQPRALPDAAAVKYGARGLGNGFLGTGLAQGLPADGYGQLGVGLDAAQQYGLKDGQYPVNGYYGNGYGCPSGKCAPIMKK